MDIRVRKILCTLDFSDYTPHVVRYGVGLAKRFDAALLMFHSVFLPRDQLYGANLAGGSGELKRKAREAREKIEEIMAGSDVDWTPAIAEGDPVDAAVRAAEKRDADLVVAVGRGISGLKRLLIGTVVERMARGLHRPILVIRPPKRLSDVDRRSPLTMRKIVVGCDLSSGAAPAMHYARHFARFFGARILLLHSMESPMDFEDSEKPQGRYDKVQQTLLRRLRDRLLDSYPADGDDGIEVDAAIETGIPGEALIRRAKRESADLLVVGIKGRGALEKILVGSTTDALIRHSPCPVLAVSSDVAGAQGRK